MFALGSTVQQWAFWLGFALSVYVMVDYHISIVRGETKPYVLTWISLGALTTMSAFLQFSDGAALGAVLTLLAGVNNFFVAIQSWRYGSTVFANNNGVPYTGWRDFVRTNRRDVGCLVVAASSAFVWLGAGRLIEALMGIVVWMGNHRPAIAVAGLSLASLAAIAMTIIKSWHNPHSEPVRKYLLSTFRYILASVAVANYTFVSGFYPTLWIGVNALMVVLLVARRRMLAASSAKKGDPITVTAAVADSDPEPQIVHLDSRLGVDPIDYLRCCGESYFQLPGEVRVTLAVSEVTCPAFSGEKVLEVIRA